MSIASSFMPFLAIAPSLKYCRERDTVGSFYYDTYSHIISGIQEGMMALLDDVIPAEKKGMSDKISIYP